MSTIHAESAPDAKARTVQVSVNGEPVELPKGEVTGLQVKQAAIAQGVRNIQPDFQLSVKRGEHYHVVGDTDLVEARRGEEFLAVAPDDNS